MKPKPDAADEERCGNELRALIENGEAVVAQIRAATEAYNAQQEVEHKRNRRPLWAAVIITSVYAVFSGFQWFTMRQQLTDSEAVQAAAVEIQNLRTDGTLTDGTISFDKKNTDQTRADDTINTFFNGRYDPHKEFSFANMVHGTELEPSINGYSIAPDAPARHISFPLSSIVNPSIAAKLRIGELGWYFGVSIAYRDVFGRAHHTTECLAYNVKADFFLPCIGGQVRK
jgi:hypothetical protein